MCVTPVCDSCGFNISHIHKQYPQPNAIVAIIAPILYRTATGPGDNDP